MTNERNSLQPSAEIRTVPFQTTGPYVAVTPNATAPDHRVRAVYDAVMTKDLESRGSSAS